MKKILKIFFIKQQKTNGLRGRVWLLKMWLDLDALCPFELHEGIKCDILKFLRVSKVVSTFFKTYFQSTLQNLLVFHIVKK